MTTLLSMFQSIGGIDNTVDPSLNPIPGIPELAIAPQFNALRSGDRFFWQNENFDPQTAQNISPTTLADIMERDTGTSAEQPNVFIARQRHASDVAAADPSAPQLVIGVNTNGAITAGGPAYDTIVAGLGLDQILTGGGGSDVFHFAGSSHRDTIPDWNENDTIQFQPSPTSGSLSAMIRTATVTLTDINGGTRVSFDGNTITLAGVQAASLVASNFLLPPGNGLNLVIDDNRPRGGFMGARDPHSGGLGSAGLHRPA